MTAPTTLAVDLTAATARFVRFVRQGAQASTATWRALAILDQHGPLRVGDFAVLDQLTQPTATAILRRLGAEGAVEKVPDPADGRASLVALTAAGRARLAELRADNAARLDPVLAALDDDDLAVLARATELLLALTDPDPAPAITASKGTPA